MSHCCASFSCLAFLASSKYSSISSFEILPSPFLSIISKSSLTIPGPGVSMPYSLAIISYINSVASSSGKSPSSLFSNQSSTFEGTSSFGGAFFLDFEPPKLAYFLNCLKVYFRYTFTSSTTSFSFSAYSASITYTDY